MKNSSKKWSFVRFRKGLLHFGEARARLRVWNQFVTLYMPSWLTQPCLIWLHCVMVFSVRWKLIRDDGVIFDLSQQPAPDFYTGDGTSTLIKPPITSELDRHNSIGTQRVDLGSRPTSSGRLIWWPSWSSRFISWITQLRAVTERCPVPDWIHGVAWINTSILCAIKDWAHLCSRLKNVAQHYLFK